MTVRVERTVFFILLLSCGLALPANYASASAVPVFLLLKRPEASNNILLMTVAAVVVTFAVLFCIAYLSQRTREKPKQKDNSGSS